MKQDQILDRYNLDKKLAQVWRLIQEELSQKTNELFGKYDTAMINDGLGKSARAKQLRMLLSISRKIDKEWDQVTKFDIDNLIKKIVNQYCDVNGDETETSRDFKKILKIFFNGVQGRNPYKTMDFLILKSLDGLMESFLKTKQEKKTFEEKIAKLAVKTRQNIQAASNSFNQFCIEEYDSRKSDDIFKELQLFKGEEQNEAIRNTLQNSIKIG